MKTTSKIIVSLVVALTSLTTWSAPAEAAAPGEPTLLKLTNAARARYRRPPLRLSASLSNIARAHSRAMANRSRIFHTRSLGRRLRSYSWRIAGENVGRAPSVQSMQRAFMRSRSHRANALSRRYRSVGIGIVWRNGSAYATLMFLG